MIRNKAIGLAVILALTCVIALAQSALATPSNKEKQRTGSNGGGGEPAIGKNGSSNGSVGHTPVEICHKGRITITVDDNAVDAHLRHGDTLISEGEECQPGQSPEEPTEEPVQEPPKETTTPEESTAVQRQKDEPKEKAQGTAQTRRNTETVETCDGKSIELKAEEKRILELHNEARKKRRLEVLCIDLALTKAARAHSKDMAENNYLGHNSPNGETSGERLKRLGYNWRASGENVAWGSGSWAKAESRFKAWIESPRHRRNILKTDYKEVGVGVETGESKNGGANKRTFYTVDFGTKKQR